ncbi:hypothetical protein [Inhella proteolytica]|uniref:Thioredoxin domain-containing protein n=1 Tax=Inhella proteolytica TaxID=2795029 RepID=A0A931J701_9BURK|nr:hypothetical protein [Inhella proteolytica]MBH9578684.1 hypothetical protein [Inhella proteolytica]
MSWRVPLMRFARRALGGMALVVQATGVVATPAPLDAAAWLQWVRSVREPTAVVFTASYCGSCPLAMEALLRHRRSQGVPFDVLAIELDGGDGRVPVARGHGELDGVQHRRAAEPVRALQQAVHPRWRGETPYLVLLRSPNEVRRVLGVPSAEDLRWLTDPAPVGAATAPR